MINMNISYHAGDMLVFAFRISCLLDHWYSTFFVRVPPDIIYLQIVTPKVVGG
jgi:hypothetical protein